MERVKNTNQPNSFDWLDGTKVGNTYNNFGENEPDNLYGNENCGVYYTSSGLWKSERCELRYYVCQRETGQSLNLNIGTSC